MKKKVKISGMQLTFDFRESMEIITVTEKPEKDDTHQSKVDSEKEKQHLEDFEDSYQEAKGEAKDLMDDMPYVFNKKGDIEGNEEEKMTKILTGHLMRVKEERRNHGESNDHSR